MSMWAPIEKSGSVAAVVSREARLVPRVINQPRHVLVVEDDLPIRAMLVDLLRDAGYGVDEAETGREALSRLQEQQPDLIVLDLMLPAMSGWQFLERAREQLDCFHVPVVIVSAIEGRSDYPSTLGAAAWFTKPLDIPRFLGAVDRLAEWTHAEGPKTTAEHSIPRSGAARSGSWTTQSPCPSSSRGASYGSEPGISLPAQVPRQIGS
jgi:CheY-like chemotaxis protein